MRDLIILGTGVHASEMVDVVERINRVAPTWNLLGHLASTTELAAKAGPMLHGVRVLGSAVDLEKYPHACFVPDNGFPRTQPLPMDRLVSLIDPSVFVSRTAKVGRGCVFFPNGVIGHNATVGDFVFALSNTVINHDDHLHDRVILCSSVTLAGGVTVESDCYLGQSCTIRQNLRIGERSLIGMGAVVIKHVEPRSVMVGNPAVRLRENVKK